MKIMLLSNIWIILVQEMQLQKFSEMLKNNVDCDLIVNKQKTELSSKFN